MSLKGHFKPVCIKKSVVNFPSPQLRKQGGRIPYSPHDGRPSSSALVSWAWADNEEGGDLWTATRLFTPENPLVCVLLLRVPLCPWPGHAEQAQLSLRGQSCGRPELLPGKASTRPVGAQRESLCFRKASSFQNLGWGQGRNKGHQRKEK